MISKFFIDRPVFASVISIIITLIGLISMLNLPLEQFPSITPPQILVTATYPGASAETIAETVAAPLEQKINGVENMIYMYSQSSSSGTLSLNVFFDIGTDIDKAQIDVQNKVNLVLSTLPLDVQRQGLQVKKQSPNFLMIVAIQSQTDRYNEIFTSNYASINIVDELKRIKGTSDVQVFGAKDYSMRIWLKPDRMAQLSITTADIAKAIREQNSQYAVGQIGQEPTSAPVELTLPVNAQGRFLTPHEFDQIILRANSDGSTVLLKDVGHAELGAQNYDVIGELNGKPTTLIAVYQQYGANALEVADNVQKTMMQLEKNFPAGLQFSIPYNITKFVDASIHEVKKTIFEASILVIIVVFVFLQSLRSTIIPMIALVVSIVGTFAGMYVFGLSINTLTLFGMVLSIGIVVDDAIVVIENVERNMRELKLNPREASIKAMEEVTGPIIAIVFVLLAVFLPVTLLGGIAGQLYKQFAITIVISVVISGLVALTLSPALATILLKPDHHPSKFALGFNRFLDKITNFYIKGVNWLIVKTAVGLSLFALLIFFIFLLYKIIPTSFVPAEDQGYVMAIAILPDGASLSRSEKVTKQLLDIVKDNEAVENVVSITGYSLLEGVNKTNNASYFIILKDWSERIPTPLHAGNVLKKLAGNFSKLPDALILPFNPPSIQGLGTVGGFEFWIQNRGNGEVTTLQTATENFIAAAALRPELNHVNTTIDTNAKQLYIDLDRTKTLSLGIPIEDVYQSLQVLLGSLYVNDFNKFGKVYKVMLQAEPEYRSRPEDIGEIYVRSNSNVMIPIKSVVQVRQVKGPILISRFNGFTAAKITGSAGSGYSSGQAMQALEEIAKDVLPEGMGYAFGGESYQESKTSGSSSRVLIGGMVMVFLILSALYENWTMPFSILLAVPFGIFGALAAIYLAGMSNDVYFQIGLVTLIALSAKNAILIVEFAIIRHTQGLSLMNAAIEAAKLRFRAILMTSLTFIFGVIPLVLSTGAGAASRISVGMGVLGGMISATFLAIFFVPLFYKLIGSFSESRGDPKK
jgi:hydrophobe/amphiphile efflux-1 (HAE1) family protein